MTAWFENCAEMEKWKKQRKKQRKEQGKGRISVVGVLYLCLSPRKGLGRQEGEERVNTCVPWSVALRSSWSMFLR